MCEAYGKLTIQLRRPDGYIKGRIGHEGFYVPGRDGGRIAAQTMAANGQTVSASLVRGMLVKLRR